MALNVKLWGSIVGVLVIGAIGAYFYMTAIPVPAAIHQSTAHELILECVDYNSKPVIIMTDPGKIESFLQKVTNNYPDLETMTLGLSEINNENIRLSSAMLKPLKICIHDLQLNLKKYHQQPH